jgi:thimet oligopeptidase
MEPLKKAMTPSMVLMCLAHCSMMHAIKESKPYCHIHSLDEVIALFPQTVQAMNERIAHAQEELKHDLDRLLAIPAGQRTFDNTVREYDRIVYNACLTSNFVSFLEHVSPDAALRYASHEAAQAMSIFFIDFIGTNVALYHAFKEYVEGSAQQEKLSESDRYFLAETMKDFKRTGLDLPAQTLEKVKQCSKELTMLALQFESNIASGQRCVTVSYQELAGLDDDFIQALQRTDEGSYILGTDYPTYHAVMEQCSVEQTRKQLLVAFGQRAYPENMPILDGVITKRDELAQLLGFKSYAHFDLDNQMVKTPERAHRFIADLVQRARIKYDQEFDLLSNHLPENVTLTDGMFKPWDVAYIKTEYKKKYANIDERIISEYFPAEKTIQGLLGIYKQFMNLRLKEVDASGLWHEDVRVIEVYTNVDNQLRGYLLLDLHPRENKFSHAASFPMINSLKSADGCITPAVDVVVANFPKSTATKPSLLLHTDVITLFHEFGHAIHTLLGATRLASVAGTHVKTDFVELPSQMLEEWMWDSAMLKRVSYHYKTGQPLPDALIEQKIALKNLTVGMHVLQQLYYASLSLSYFEGGAYKNTKRIADDLHQVLLTHVARDPNVYMQASFGHLMGYGAKYYGYMWSKVFALDLFSVVKKYGLLNPEIGQRYSNEILGKGGSVDPNVLLNNFLGREPNQEAFLKDMGL